MTSTPSPDGARRASRYRPTASLIASLIAALLAGLLPIAAVATSYVTVDRCELLNIPVGDGGWTGPGITASTKAGETVLKRTVTFFVKFRTGQARSPQVLAALGNWLNAGQLVQGTIMPVVIQNDPTPFTSKIGIRMSHKGQAINRGPLQQTILSFTELTPEDTTYVFGVFQELVLLVDPKDLPAGDIKITGIINNAMVELFTYSVDASQGIIGSTVGPHPGVNACSKNLATGALHSALVPRQAISNKCRVDAATFPVHLGAVSAAEVTANPNWKGPPSSPITLKLSECANAAKPQVWFRDENQTSNTSDTLSVTGGAQGIGIAMYSLPAGGAEKRVRYFNTAPAPGSADLHTMERSATDATLTLYGRYVRTSGPVKAGQANGLASYFITFP